MTKVLDEICFPAISTGRGTVMKGSIVLHATNPAHPKVRKILGHLIPPNGE
jgi:hypothetical protein